MQTNTYFLSALAPQLTQRWAGRVLVEAYTQSADELVLDFNRGAMIVHLGEPRGLELRETHARARRNAFDLFASLVGKAFERAEPVPNDRSLILHFEGGQALLVKFHGARSNAIRYEDQQAVELFRRSLEGDLSVALSDYDRTADFAQEAWTGKPYATFGSLARHYAQAQGIDQMAKDDQWRLWMGIRERLEQPRFWLVHMGGEPKLSLLPVGDIIEKHDDPLSALDAYWPRVWQEVFFEKEKAALVRERERALTKHHAALGKVQTRLAHWGEGLTYREQADLLMANLHAIPSGANQATVSDFYHEGKSVTLTWKEGVSAQVQAQKLYQKARQQGKEKEVLEQAIESHQTALARLAEELEVLQAANTKKELARFQKEEKAKAVVEEAPYHLHDFQGYQILVGRNSKANDKLTFGVAKKDDLWLHARGFSGSHVVIRRKGKEGVPASVKEQAARLAAFHSKGKREGTCPVICTERKFVRKPKGASAGAVLVDREEVILVPPEPFS